MRDRFACVRWVLWARVVDQDWYVHDNGVESTTSLRHARRFESETEAMTHASALEGCEHWTPVRLAPVIDLQAREIVA